MGGGTRWLFLLMMERERGGPKREEASRQGILSLVENAYSRAWSVISSFCAEPSSIKLN
jgi:hypothetical protein